MVDDWRQCWDGHEDEGEEESRGGMRGNADIHEASDHNGADTYVSPDQAYDTNASIQYHNDEFNAELKRQREETYTNLMRQLTREEDEAWTHRDISPGSHIPEIVDTCNHDWRRGHDEANGYSIAWQCIRCGEVSRDNPIPSPSSGGYSTHTQDWLRMRAEIEGGSKIVEEVFDTCPHGWGRWEDEAGNAIYWQCERCNEISLTSPSDHAHERDSISRIHVTSVPPLEIETGTPEGKDQRRTTRNAEQKPGDIHSHPLNPEPRREPSTQ